MTLCVQIFNDEDMTLDVQIPLADQGFKSIHAVQLSQLLKTRLGLTTETTTFYKYPTILKLSEHIKEELFTSKESNRNAAERKSEEKNETDLLTKIESLSDEDILMLLDESF